MNAPVPPTPPDSTNGPRKLEASRPGDVRLIRLLAWLLALVLIAFVGKSASYNLAFVRCPLHRGQREGQIS